MPSHHTCPRKPLEHTEYLYWNFLTSLHVGLQGIKLLLCWSNNVHAHVRHAFQLRSGTPYHKSSIFDSIQGQLHHKLEKQLRNTVTRSNSKVYIHSMPWCWFVATVAHTRGPWIYYCLVCTPLWVPESKQPTFILRWSAFSATNQQLPQAWRFCHMCFVRPPGAWGTDNKLMIK